MARCRSRTFRTAGHVRGTGGTGTVLDEVTARSAYGALHTYTIGFAALEASRAGWTPDRAGAEGVGRQLSAYTTGAQFTEGLHYLLEGISRHTAKARTRPVTSTGDPGAEVHVQRADRILRP